MNEKEINQIIKSIWMEHKGQDGTCRLPLLFTNHKHSPEILFIGINPAFQEELIDKKEEELVLHDIKAKGTKKEDSYQYFKPFYDFTDNWDHLDLFFLRETNQNKVKTILGCVRGIILNDFAKKQLDLFEPMVKEINPKIIVVNNALASDILKKYFLENIDRSMFSIEGFDRISIDGKKIPIFFSGMLSGQRALDKESKRRLIWQVNHIFQIKYRRDDSNLK